MKNFNLSLVVFFLLFFLSSATTATKAQSRSANGILLTVNNNGDSVDVNPGDGLCADAAGQCTLRAAIEESNFVPRRDVIVFALSFPATINLTLGQLPITGSVDIVGPGARLLTVRRASAGGTPNSRIFFVNGNAGTFVGFRRLKISNGNAGAERYGGGVYIAAGNFVYMGDVAISDNAADFGGGIANFGGLNLTRSTLNSNTANFEAGGISNNDSAARATISNSTITENSSGGICGAICNNAYLLLVNDTITHNVASLNASSVGNNGGTVNVLNTIIGSNNSSTVNALAGSFNSLGNNIITDARGGSGFTNASRGDQVSDGNTINPQLGVLADNGGQTDTRALQNSSPAINTGNNCVFRTGCSVPGDFLPFRLDSDQRPTYSRQVGGAVDVGAFEAGAGPGTGSASFGVSFVRISNRLSNALTILTNARTNEKRYAVTNPFGNVSFMNLGPGEIYILEIKTKRALGLSPTVIDFDSFAFTGFDKNETAPELLTENKRRLTID